MFFALVVPLVLASPPAHAVVTDDPPIRVSLDHHGQYLRGDRARVDVRAARDGYVVVLRADAAGRVRVLFPLDPGDDSFIRGGRTFEVRGRGGREAFFVDEPEGTGLVFAAWSADALRFDEFVQGDHWDYRSLGAGAVADDPEGGLLELARRMAGGGSFEYDLVPYFIEAPGAYPSHSWSGYGCPGCGSWYGGGSGISFSIGFGWGYPYHYSPFFYPYGYYPFGYPLWASCWWPCNPYAYPYYGVGYAPYRYGYGSGVHQPFVPKTTVFGKPVEGGPRFGPRPRGATAPAGPGGRGAALAPRGRGERAATVAPRRATDTRTLGRPGPDTPRGLRDVGLGRKAGERRASVARPDGPAGGREAAVARRESSVAGRGASSWSGARSLRRADGGRALAPRGRMGPSPGMTRGAGSARPAMRGRR